MEVEIRVSVDETYNVILFTDKEPVIPVLYVDMMERLYRVSGAQGNDMGRRNHPRLHRAM
ncbi:MAG: hypothetical protein NPIRA02_00520 [Nitrospirales bacterium]|nr:MAG: hypothetical protein NPIRA02_00520 [Nitrospirales bacterium]